MDLKEYVLPADYKHMVLTKKLNFCRKRIVCIMTKQREACLRELGSGKKKERRKDSLPTLLNETNDCHK